MSALEQAVADLLLKVTSAAEAAGRFAVEQLPDVAQQYVLYVAIKSWVWFGAGVFLLALAVWLCKKAWRDLDADEAPFLLISSPLSFLIGSIIVGANIGDAILATWAPKILLIQWAAELLK